MASWISVAGWASAAQRLWGEAWIVTPRGILTPDEIVAIASDPRLRRPHAKSSWRRVIPAILKTAMKDLRKAAQARRFREAAVEGPWRARPPRFVWQRHDLFHTAGLVAARSLRRPLVLFVPALIVREASTWGVRRRGWAGFLEAQGERPQIRSADLVACGSREIAEGVTRMGVHPERVIVTPNGVDTHRFSPDRSGARVRGRLGLEDRFVIGWTGSFRRFHGLDMALEAMRILQEDIPEAALLLVGDGLDRPRIERLARDLGLHNVLMPGAAPYQEIPEHIAAMDVALVTDRGDDEYHYSPLKLREYMACGKAVVAASVGEVGRWLTDGRDALLVESGDAPSLARAIRKLYEDPDRRRALGSSALQKVVSEATWEVQLQRIDTALRRLTGVGTGTPS